MIKIINEELFNVTGGLVSNTNGDYYKYDVTSSVEVLKGKGKEKTPVHQVITKIISEEEDFNGKNTAISRLNLNSGATRVSIKSSDRNKYDSRIFLIALPFNGLATPLEDSHLYKIHRGVIATSKKRDIEVGNETYKKVLYLMITLNESVFLEDHKYHTDEIVIPFVSYNLESREENQDAETVKTTITLRFTSDGYTYGTVSEPSEPVKQEDFKGQLFKLYDKNNKKYSKERQSVKEEKSYDNMIEEKSPSDSNLDDMIAQYQKDVSRNEKNRNKKGKKKRR